MESAPSPSPRAATCAAPPPVPAASATAVATATPMDLFMLPSPLLAGGSTADSAEAEWRRKAPVGNTFRARRPPASDIDSRPRPR